MSQKKWRESGFLNKEISTLFSLGVTKKTTKKNKKKLKQQKQLNTLTLQKKQPTTMSQSKINELLEMCDTEEKKSRMKQLIDELLSEVQDETKKVIINLVSNPEGFPFPPSTQDETPKFPTYNGDKPYFSFSSGRTKPPFGTKINIYPQAPPQEPRFSFDTKTPTFSFGNSPQTTTFSFGNSPQTPTFSFGNSPQTQSSPFGNQSPTVAQTFSFGQKIGVLQPYNPSAGSNYTNLQGQQTPFPTITGSTPYLLLKPTSDPTSNCFGFPPPSSSSSVSTFSFTSTDPKSNPLGFPPTTISFGQHN